MELATISTPKHCCQKVFPTYPYALVHFTCIFLYFWLSLKCNCLILLQMLAALMTWSVYWEEPNGGETFDEIALTPFQQPIKIWQQQPSRISNPRQRSFFSSQVMKSQIEGGSLAHSPPPHDMLPFKRNKDLDLQEVALPVSPNFEEAKLAIWTETLLLCNVGVAGIFLRSRRKDGKRDINWDDLPPPPPPTAAAKAVGHQRRLGRAVIFVILWHASLVVAAAAAGPNIITLCTTLFLRSGEGSNYCWSEELPAGGINRLFFGRVMFPLRWDSSARALSWQHVRKYFFWLTKCLWLTIYISKSGTSIFGKSNLIPLLTFSLVRECLPFWRFVKYKLFLPNEIKL